MMVSCLVDSEVILDWEMRIVWVLEFANGVMVLMLAWSAAASFWYERDCGIWELLLVAPVAGPRLFRHRMFALWMTFSPAWMLLILALCVAGLHVSRLPAAVSPGFVPWMLVLEAVKWLTTLFTVALVGFYFASYGRGTMAGWAWTVALTAPATIWSLPIYSVAIHWVAVYSVRPLPLLNVLGLSEWVQVVWLAGGLAVCVVLFVGFGMRWLRAVGNRENVAAVSLSPGPR